jgi:adenylosuccinate lyase
LLVAGVKSGLGREEAHEIIKEQALAAALELRDVGGDNRFFERLGADERFPLDRRAIEASVGAPIDLAGLAEHQVAAVARRVQRVVERLPDAGRYRPGSIL